jgi:tetratricopeptide (TPR) repeat protein
VISRASSFSFKGKDVPLKEIAATLGVAYVLDGSVQRSGKTLRITAQLIDARTDDNVWSDSWDRPFDDVFAIQDEIAGTVVAQLKLKLLGKAQQIDLDAYAMFLRARQLARQGTGDGYAESISLLQQVLAKAPGYAPALVELGGVYLHQGGVGLRPALEALKLSREAFDAALAADPDDASAHAGLGHLEMTFGNDLPVAARHIEQAMRLDPANAYILSTAAVFVSYTGRIDLAIDLINAAIALDPLSVSLHFNLGVMLGDARRYPEAIAALGTALRLSPEIIGGHAQLGLTLLNNGDGPAALAEVQKEVSNIHQLIYSAIVYHALGRSSDSDAALADAIAKYEKEAPENIASVYAYRGDADSAFEWLDKAEVYQDGGLSEIVTDSLFDNIRNDPRWLPLLRKLGKDPETFAKIEFNVTPPNFSSNPSRASGARDR